jgi:hypothetical protein
MLLTQFRMRFPPQFGEDSESLHQAVPALEALKVSVASLECSRKAKRFRRWLGASGRGTPGLALTLPGSFVDIMESMRHMTLFSVLKAITNWILARD